MMMNKNVRRKMITKEQATHIVELVQTIRPSWDEPGILAALVKVRDRSLADITTAAINAAADPTMHTPKSISFSGPHWPKHGGSNGAMLDEPKCYICGLTRSRCWARHDFEIKHGLPDPHAFETAEDAERNSSRYQLNNPSLMPVGRTLGRSLPYVPEDMTAAAAARAELDHAAETQPDAGPTTPPTQD
jgi:hypothetical protein